MSLATATTYGFVLLTAFSLYLQPILFFNKQVKPWIFVAIAVGISGWISGNIDPLGSLALVLLWVLSNASEKPDISRFFRVLLVSLTIALFLVIATNMIPWFESYQAIDHQIVKPHSTEFSLSWKINMALAGIVLIGTSIGIQSSKNHLKSIFSGIAIPFLLTAAGVLTFATMTGLIKPEMPTDDWFNFLVWYAPAQVLGTCLAEEALFRGIIQKKLQRFLVSKMSGWTPNFLAILIAAILFGLAHFRGGYEFVIAATMAGFGYGYVYYKTNRIESAIITHFLFNLTYYTFFTYPLVEK